MKRPFQMTARARLSRETAQTSTTVTLAVGVISFLCFLVVRILCGTPYRVMLELGISDLMPPIWLFTLLQAVAFFTTGCAAGFVLGNRTPCLQAEKYKGGMFFVITLAVELCWYPLLFVRAWVIAVLLQAIFNVLLAIYTTACFFRVGKFAGWIMVLHNVWLVYLLLLTFRIFFQN